MPAYRVRLTGPFSKTPLVVVADDVLTNGGFVRFLNRHELEPSTLVRMFKVNTVLEVEVVDDGTASPSYPDET